MPRRCSRCLVLLALTLGVASCDDDEPRPLPDGVTRTALALPAPNGLSGLTRDGDGRLWAVAEADRFVVRIDGERGVALPLEGVPDGLDTESIAWVEGNRFLLGTESMDEQRDGDDVLVVELDDDRARVVDRVRLPYAVLGVRAEENHGIEALCVVGGRWYAVLENVRGEGDHRQAPLAVYDGERWRPHAIALTSETGKIAGLACRERDGVIEAHAIERHFGVMRLLALELPGLAAPRATLAPRILRNLDERLEGDPNLEGIAYDGDGLALIVDNHHGRRTGDSELVRVRL